MSFAPFFELIGRRASAAEKKDDVVADEPDKERRGIMQPIMHDSPASKPFTREPSVCSYSLEPQQHYNCREIMVQMEIISECMKEKMRKTTAMDPTGWWVDHNRHASMEKYRHMYHMKNCDDILTLQREVKVLTQAYLKANASK